MAAPARSTDTADASALASLAASAGVGVVAAVVGYLASFLVIASEAREGPQGEVPAWIGVAWYHFNAHLVEVETTGEVGPVGARDTVDLIAASGSTNATALYAIPPIVLVGAGVVLAVHLDARSIGEAVVVGAPVAIGYAVVMTILALVAETSYEGEFFGVEVSGSMSPELLPAILLAGVLYPLVFATAGAILAAVVRS